MFALHSSFLIIIWKPVIERDFGQEKFSTVDPTKLFQQGRCYRISVMTTIMKYELLHSATCK